MSLAGFEGTDMDVVIDLGNKTQVTSVSSSYMAAVGSWIFLPQKVEYYYSLTVSISFRLARCPPRQILLIRVIGLRHISPPSLPWRQGTSVSLPAVL
jgi:hypothetical protein